MKGENKQEKKFNHDSYSNKRQLSDMYSFSPSTEGEDREDGGTQDFRPAASGENDVPAAGGINEDRIEQFAGWLCNAVESRIKQITQFVKENTEMALQAPSKGNSQSQQKANRSSRRGDSSGFPNLRTADVDFNKKQFKVIDAKEPGENNQYNNAIILKIVYDGRTFLWNLKASNPCYETLYNTAKNGSNPQDYVGISGYMFLQADEFSGVNYIRIEIEQTKKR